MRFPELGSAVAQVRMQLLAELGGQGIVEYPRPYILISRPHWVPNAAMGSVPSLPAFPLSLGPFPVPCPQPCLQVSS